MWTLFLVVPNKSHVPYSKEDEALTLVLEVHGAEKNECASQSLGTVPRALI